MNDSHTQKKIKHTDRTYKDKTTDIIVEEIICDLYATFDNSRAYLCGKYIVSMMQRAQLIYTDMPGIISISRN